VGLVAGGAGAGSVVDNGAATVGFAVAVGVVVVVGRAIARKATYASLDDIVFVGLVLLVNLLEKWLLLEEQQKQGLESRLTTKQGNVAGVVVLVVVGPSIAWKATAVSWDGTVCRVGDVLVNTIAVLVSRIPLLCEERHLLEEQLLPEERRRGLDSRLTTKQNVVVFLVIVAQLPGRQQSRHRMILFLLFLLSV